MSNRVLDEWYHVPCCFQILLILFCYLIALFLYYSQTTCFDSLYIKKIFPTLKKCVQYMQKWIYSIDKEWSYCIAYWLTNYIYLYTCYIFEFQVLTYLISNQNPLQLVGLVKSWSHFFFIRQLNKFNNTKK